MSTKRFIARAGVVAVAAGVATMFGAGLASAHVTAKVLGEAAQQGGYAKITFRVPNEDDTAGTVKVEVKLPADTPLTSARTTAMAGWTAKVTKVTLDKPVKVHGAEIKEAVSSVVWTAAKGTRINPGEFEEFELSAGPLPEAEQLVMPAIQTYDNGEVVAWDQPPAEDGSEPQNPAPVIELAAGGDDHHGGSAAPDVDNAAAESGDHDEDGEGDGDTDGDTDAAAAAGTDDTARWLGGAGLVVGALGLGFGVGATMRARKAVAARGPRS